MYLRTYVHTTHRRTEVRTNVCMYVRTYVYKEENNKCSYQSMCQYGASFICTYIGTHNCRGQHSGLRDCMIAGEGGLTYVCMYVCLCVRTYLCKHIEA